jgi:SulP family sulfate permease
VAGAANLLCGLGGGLPGYQSASSTTMAYLVGGRGRTVGLVAALLCGLALAFAAPLIAYLPKLLLGLMLLYAAIELATVLIRDQWARMPAADRVVLVVVLVSFLALGFLEGLVIGIVAGLAVFAFSYARVDLVREGGNAARYRSTVFRPAAQLQALDQDPDAIQVIALQGYLFFGSVHNLLQRVGVLLGAAAGGGRGAGCLILDFARVDGADASALFAFTRLLQRARKQGRPVLFAAVPPGLARALPGAVATHSFADLDHALEHAENAVLGLERTSAPRARRPRGGVSGGRRAPAADDLLRTGQLAGRRGGAAPGRSVGRDVLRRERPTHRLARAGRRPAHPAEHHRAGHGDRRNRLLSRHGALGDRDR